ncbi:electron transfer flavoprotein alpha subunit [Puccinia sorghi]|uniref:Probable electron transfer flavoprotein subunit alpha n=1 Tax=Puccinia sorghi TaxID=27349 RepID=A0A0L6UYH7_9BASI|nr:electron transfer flavoprotein alpha subunit [Puccinia sorghi]
MRVRPPVRSLKTAASTGGRCISTLVLIEHREGKINSATLSALTAAQQLAKSDITGLITGSSKTVGFNEAIELSKKLPIKKLLVKEDSSLERYVAEPLAPLITSLVKEKSFSHLIGGSSSMTKNVFPRIAAQLDVSQISEVMKIIDEKTFVRPIYAGNALMTLSSGSAVQVLTIRSASFEPIKLEESGSASMEVEKLEGGVKLGEGKEGDGSRWESELLAKSARPELGSAKRIVSGGRGVKNKENFEQVLTPLADKLNSAIGASRAAVDSGFADNSLQVGQTGKVVSPDLYIAVGISGAIQHLAGMKDSKTIVAINKDPEAPIFQVADVGLVADLFEAVPLSGHSGAYHHFFASN